MDSMDANDPDGYRLSRDRVASIRLNAQHYLWKAICGFNIHPAILEVVGPSPKIADIGTGTGIWMIDVKSEHPSFQIDGSDISLKQCPAPQQAPKGCSYRQLNMLEEVPEDMHGVYDIVHVRLVIGALKNDPTVALKNFITMLKPGGHLQWQEYNKATLGVAAVRPELIQKPTAISELVDMVHAFPFGKWSERLSEICSEQGLVESQTFRYPLSPELAVPFCQTQISAQEEISRGSMNNDTPESEGPRYRKLLGRASEELLEGIWIDHKLEVTMARKPF